MASIGAKGHLLACLTYSDSTAKTVNMHFRALVNQAAQLTSAVDVKAIAGCDGAAAGAALPGSPLKHRPCWYNVCRQSLGLQVSCLQTAGFEDGPSRVAGSTASWHCL